MSVMTIFVAGGTGAQGGAVVSALLEKGHEVRVLTRNSGSEKAVALAKRNVEVLAGDMMDPETLQRSMAGVDGAYLMTTPFEAGVEAETRQGRNMLDAAKADNVGHVVLSTVGGADKNTGIPHFDSKFDAEVYSRELGVPTTISAPVYFMENALAPWNIDGLKAGTFTAAMPADRALQQIAVRNVGEFAAALFERGEAVLGKRYDIAGDEVTGAETVRILSEVFGHPIEYSELPLSVLREQSDDMALMYEWFNNVGYSADVEGLRRDFADVNWLTLAEWAKTQSLG